MSNIYPESPSEKAGLREGDIILQVDGVHISSQSNFETMCTGNKGDVIKIVVERGTDTIVVANILADVLVPLTPVILNQLKPGGIYITSGIIDDKEQTVVEAVKAAGMEVLEVTYQGEWVSVTARK